ncbi:MAG: cysteine desulfurase [Chloroflexi bacterium]|nr:cysteine desulfurase [Chloroflexota bacterium]
MTNQRIYLDHSASTPVDERVVEAMLPYFRETYGNPTSVHRYGQEAEAALERARQTVADILNCQPREVIFTSCGSESDNLAIRGAALAARQAGKDVHLITQPLEHSAVTNTVKQLTEVFGFASTFLPVDNDGQVSPETLRSHIDGKTAVISLMTANNEIGTILPIADLAGVAHEMGAVFHTDAVQAAGQVDLDVQKSGVDLLSISAHKFYGPKGVGALYVREGTIMLPIQTGGSHENGLRSGTQNVPLIVGLAKALEIATSEREQHVAHYTGLRDLLIEAILTRMPNARLTGSRTERLPSHASFAFKDIDANTLLMQLDMKGIAASSGSACKTGNPTPSEVLLAIGLDDSWALGGLRLSVGRQTTDQDIAKVMEVLPDAVAAARQLWIGT